MAVVDRVLVGESLVGDGNEVAHIDLIMGREATGTVWPLVRDWLARYAPRATAPRSVAM